MSLGMCFLTVLVISHCRKSSAIAFSSIQAPVAVEKALLLSSSIEQASILTLPCVSPFCRLHCPLLLQRVSWGKGIISSWEGLASFQLPAHLSQVLEPRGKWRDWADTWIPLVEKGIQAFLISFLPSACSLSLSGISQTGRCNSEITYPHIHPGVLHKLLSQCLCTHATCFNLWSTDLLSLVALVCSLYS